MQPFPKCRGLLAAKYLLKLLGRGLLYRIKTTENRQQLTYPGWTYPLDFEQTGTQLALIPALPVKRDRKPVRLITDHLDQVQHW